MLSPLVLRPHVFASPTTGPVAGELGRLTVPLHHDAGPDAGTIDVGVARVPSSASRPGPPIVVLAGGPGGAAIAPMASNLERILALAEVADVILVDQRGVGSASPNLTTPGRFDLPLGEPATRESLIAEARRLAGPAVEFWSSRGIDLTGFTTVESADDIDALRQGLGAEKISLMGGSYGSHLAMAVVKRHGDHIHRVVLTGVEGPDDTIKLPSAVEAHFQKVSDLAAADPVVGRAVPDLIGLMKEVLSRLADNPVEVEVPDRERDGKVRITVGPFDLQRWTTMAAGAPQAIAALPGSYLRFEAGDFSALAANALAHRRRWLGNAMSWVMDSASGASAARRQRIEAEAASALLGDAIDLPHPYVGDAWGAPDLGDDFRSPVHSQVEALLVSGELDGRTPAANADAVAEGLPNAHRVLVEGMSHAGPVPDELTVALVEFHRSGQPPADSVHFGAPLPFDAPDPLTGA